MSRTDLALSLQGVVLLVAILSAYFGLRNQVSALEMRMEILWYEHVEGPPEPP